MSLWFRVQSGTLEGRVILRGWMHTAIGQPLHASGLMSVATCPRCFAMVLTDPDDGHGDQSRSHEKWHADTDYPIPEELL